MARRDRLERAIAAIDAANADDPNTLEVRGGVRPKEQAHAELMTEWVRRLDPDADEAQLLAARAHHLRRWTLPRVVATPRAGPATCGGARRCKQAARRRGGAILLERGLRRRHDRAGAGDHRQGRACGTDPPVQVHEDALCLVFLETQLAALVDDQGDEKMLDVIRKTAAKMSPPALALVAELPMRDHDRALVARALGSEAPKAQPSRTATGVDRLTVVPSPSLPAVL